MFERYCLSKEALYLFIDSEIVEYGKSALIKLYYFFFLRCDFPDICPDIFSQSGLIDMYAVKGNIQHVPEDGRGPVHFADE